MNYLLIFLGGGLGAVCRFLLNSLILRWAGERFPLGILACNVLGCFLIGIAVGYAAKSAPAWFGPLAIIGFLGGFTTFSTFAGDTLALFEDRGFTPALTNVLLSVASCLVAVYLGMKLGPSDS